MKKLTSLLVFPLLGLTAIQARVVPGAGISSNMVLQQQADARIYGTADPQATVTVTPSWDNTPRTAKADASGRWSLSVPTPAGSQEAYTVTLSDGEPLVLDNVLVGEVWLASGQSNMEMPLKGFSGAVTDGGFEEIASAARSAGKVRFLKVPKRQTDTPQDTISATWTVPSPQTAPEYSAVAWHFANRVADALDVPVGIVFSAYGGAKVESWSPREILETYPDVSLRPEDIKATVAYLRPMVMYNAMFHPIRNYTYKGIIWYQGCCNVNNAPQYARRIANMVEHWRGQIGLGDIPFYAVEIAPYQYDAPDERGRAPFLREAQWQSLSLIPNSDMICINDLVKPHERHNIHPAEKKAVGQRLGDLALVKTYGCTQFMAGSPRYRSHRFEDGAAWVAIDSPNGGICRNYDIQGFELAGADKVFHPADDVRLEWRTNEVVVRSDKVKEPVAVRYAFRDFLPGTLHGGNYLPLVPFRTDDWDEPTD